MTVAPSSYVGGVCSHALLRLRTDLRVLFASSLACIGQDVLLHRYSANPTRLIELAYDTAHIPAETQYSTYLNNLVSQSQVALNNIASTMQTTLAAKTSVSDTILNRLPALIQSIGTANNTIAADAPEAIAQTFRPIEGNVVKEILAKENARSSITDRVANTLTSITAANTYDSRDMISLINDDYAYRNGIVDSISTQVSAFVSQESARAATKSASLASDSAATQTAMSSTIATSMSAQVVRANSQIAINPTPTSLKMPTLTGSLDGTAWFVSLLFKSLR